MDTLSFRRGNSRGAGGHEANGRGRPHSKNKTWVANGLRNGTNAPNHPDNDRWERGGHRGGRGRQAGRPQTNTYVNTSQVASHAQAFGNVVDGREDEHHEEEYEEEIGEDQLHEEIEEPALETPEAREKFYQELVKSREIERKQAIANGKMDDPLIPKRLEDAITMVGTCMDMAPRFERYRRERENNLFEWETIPGTKRVDHQRAVKMYERAAGDKTLPSDLRPPHVLKKTLDYLFHDLLPRGGFSQTFNFIRDRSRAVRNDFTMQHETGPLAIECHDRCARFHIIALHLERERPGFSIALEEQQLMNTLQSLKEFYEDQRGRYESPTELEMRVYHRLIHIRDQKERHEDVPSHIVENPVFKLTTRFRQHVQARSAPISKSSKLVVDAHGMEIFGELAVVLKEQGSVVMIYLVACILERLFGPETIDDIENIRGDISISDIIDGLSPEPDLYDQTDENLADESQLDLTAHHPSSSLSPVTAESSSFGQALSASPQPFVTATSPQPAQSAFSNLSSTPNAFGSTSVFGVPFATQSEPPKSVFGVPNPSPFPPTPPFGSKIMSNSLPSSGRQSMAGSLPTSSAFLPQSTSSMPPLQTNGPFPDTATLGQTPTVSFFTPPPSTHPVNIFGFGSRKEVTAQTLSEHSSDPPRPTLSFTDSALNPTTPAFFPSSRLPPSPLRFDGVETPFQTPHNVSLARSIPASAILSQNTSIFNISSPSTPVPEPNDRAVKDTYSTIGSLPAFSNSSSFSTTPPSRPRINTTPSDPIIVPDLPQSPLPQPPPLNKRYTISLPPTPTAISGPASYLSPVPPKPAKSIIHLVKTSLQTDTPVSNEVLSPKRRATLSMSSDSPPRKRAKMRVSGEYRKPHTDEELAQRFKANHDEHERRWARGSFLLVIQNYIKRRSTAYPPGWQIWLSMNPESDGTAIWLERKFDVPASGHWTSETIFSIPLENSGDSPVSPGLIVFERTPTEGITDEIERKYRILDDCSRLRDILETLPSRRHFVPSIITVSWAERDDVSVDFNTMLSKLVNDGVLGSSQNFSVTNETMDLDSKLEDVLGTTAFDVEGKLVQLLSVQGVFKSFESTWVDFSSVWVASCFANGAFDWFLYGKVVEASVGLLNSMATLCQGLIGINQSNMLHSFSPNDILDSNTAYGTIVSWLQKTNIREAASMASDLVSQRSMQRDFPSETFVDQLHQLIICLLERQVAGKKEHYPSVLKAELAAAACQVETTASSRADSLRKIFSLRTHRSPKRRSFDFEESETSRFSTPSKRRKISLSNASTPSDGASPASSPPSVHNLSPSPTASVVTTTADAESPSITIAMLRALTRDVKTKYGGSPLANG